MRQLLIILAELVVAVSLSISPALGTNLAMYRWQNRLLLVFSPTESDPRFLAIDQNLSKARLDVEDRDLVVFRIFEKARSRVGEQPLVPEDAEKLRSGFEISHGKFTVILIGKDGGVKMVREGRVELREIFDRIDIMPMRRQEMREKRKTRVEQKQPHQGRSSSVVGMPNDGARWCHGDISLESESNSLTLSVVRALAAEKLHQSSRNVMVDTPSSPTSLI
jgi:hypothetical protein